MKMKSLPVQEIWAITFMSLYSYMILSVSGISVIDTVLFLAGQSAVFLATIFAHEYGHFLAARSAGVVASITWLPQPTVFCGSMTTFERRLIAVAGPLAGTLIATSGISLLVISLDLPAMLYAIAGSMAIVQLSMLVPYFADGKALFDK